MATKSFAEAEKEAPAQEASTQETTVVEPVPAGGDKALAVKRTGPPAHYVEGEDAEGEFSSRDMLWPSLTIITKTSNMAEMLGIGTWAINKETAIGKMDKPLKVIAVKIQKAYQEQLPYGAQVRPRIFRTAQEVYDAGLTLEWDTDQPRAAEVLGVRFWVPQPEGVDAPGVFTLGSPEGPGAICKFFAARTTYGTVGKTLINASQTFLRKDNGGLKSKWWELTATKEARNNNTWLLPRLRAAENVDPKLQAFLEDLGV